jgi:hypothetical protein
MGRSFNSYSVKGCSLAVTHMIHCNKRGNHAKELVRVGRHAIALMPKASFGLRNEYFIEKWNSYY